MSRCSVNSLLTLFLAAVPWSPAAPVLGFVTPFGSRQRQRSGERLALDAAKVGIFFGTSTGSTDVVANLIAEQFGEDADGPFDVDGVEGSVTEMMSRYEALVVGTPTWNTGADTERSGTGWDEIYYGALQNIDIAGRMVAVFGLGDQESYGENFADAAGELHDVFEKLGCKMMGYTSQEGYEHTDSKSIRGDKFCGLICDMANQEELSESRVEAWVRQLRDEGFLGNNSGSEHLPSAVNGSANDKNKYDDVIATLERNSEMLKVQLDAGSGLKSKLQDNMPATSSEGFVQHFNPVTKSSMWTSPDGRKCFYTVQEQSRSSSP